MTMIDKKQQPIATRTAWGKQLGLILSLIFLLPSACFANSSWGWLTDAPYTLLPLAIALTLIIETLGLIRFAGVFKPWRALFIVSVANVCSFIVPYFMVFFLDVFFGWENPWSWSHIERRILNGPDSYLVNLFSVAITLVVELPVVYYGLRNTVSADGRRRLFWTIVWLNLLTTLIVAIIERMACVGGYLY
jgi:hypothetical protein